ncbi:MAG: hypothetical protein U0T83_06450 [Bacteriovoracaceae bacterium]
MRLVFLSTIFLFNLSVLYAVNNAPIETFDEIQYAWKDKKQNECVQIYKNSILRNVDKEKCLKSKNIEQRYVECDLNSSALSVDSVFQLDKNIKLIGPIALFNDQKSSNYFKNDLKAKNIFFQKLYNYFYLPCLKTNTADYCRVEALQERDDRLKLMVEKRNLIELLKKFYNKNYIITLDRDLVGFHYQDKERIGLSFWDREKTTENKIINYVRYSSSRANEEGDENQDSLGRGMYFANDPVASEEYGNFGIRINFRKGDRIFDLRQNKDVGLYNGIPLPINLLNTNSILKRCGLLDYKINGKNALFSKQKLINSCGDIFRPIFKELGVRGVIYNFNSKISETCNGPGYAFVQWSDKFDPSDISYFDRDSLKKGEFKREKALDGQLDENQVNYYIYAILKGLPTDLSEQKKKTILKKYKEKVLGCDLQKYPNDIVRSSK